MTAVAQRAVWLKQLPLFAGAELESLELFAAAMEERQLAPGYLLCRQGDAGAEVFLIKQGDVEIHIEQDGRVVATDRISAGSCVGEMAVLTGQPRSATVCAGSKGALVLVVPGTHFRNLLLLQPAVGVQMLGVMSQRLRQTELRKRSAELARRADELAESKAAADAASKAKSDFLASMSHEIRTPLNGIIGLTELVLETQLTGTQREYLTMVRESGETLLALINDILDFSKIEAGRMDLEAAPFDLRDRLGDTLKSLAVRAHKKGLELAYRVHPDVPDRLIGDIARLRQIIINLVGNALKFTEQGEIVVEVCVDDGRCAPADAKDRLPTVRLPTLHFSVRDTGIGIPQDKVATLFEQYTQADASIARRYGGTGLGLSISAKLVELMKGRIWAESAAGQGSTFHFTAALQAEMPVAAAERGAWAGRHVVVLVKNATVRHILADMLREAGAEAGVAADVTAALSVAREAERNGQPIYGAVIDATLAEANDFALVAELRTLAGGDALGTVVLVTAIESSVAAQCDERGIAHLLKPVKAADLLDALRAAGGGGGAGHPRPDGLRLAEPPLAGHRLLLAEDNVINQRLAVALLENDGHQVVVVPNGREAVAAVAQQSFDAVLMDVMMPEMDGLEATRAIRDRERQTGGHVPIIAMTAHALEEEAQRCSAAGMDAFLTKPIRAQRLFETLAQVLGERRAAVAADERGATVGTVIDWPAALARVGGSRELLGEMAGLLVQECPRLLDEVANAARRRDASALRLAAHTLKGSVSIVGAEHAVAHAQRLEDLGRDARFDGVDVVVTDLMRETRGLLYALARPMVL